MDEILKDPRFAHVANDPRFKRIPKSERKVKIDKRFESMFKDDRFKVKYTVDKRGRPVNHSTDEDLKRYYELSSSGEEDDVEEEEENNEREEVGKFVRPPKSDLDDEKLSDNVKKKLQDLKVDYARGEGRLLSESSSDEETDESETSEDEGVEHDWGALDKDAPTTDEITNRLAACNMDWDRIRAIDLMVLFNSFLPSGGVIKSVTIYPSEFGLERMKEEEIKGPLELVSTENVESEDEDGNEEGSKYHMEKLRQYQLNRLKYYYAIIVCDTPETANKLYTECDGLEYESSATKLDLRFVPDDTTFDQEPKEVCDKIPDLTKYQPRYFTTTALQQAKVQLTWDETNPERNEIAQKLMSGKIDDITDADLQNYLANSSEDEADASEEENEIGSDSDEDEEQKKDVNRIDKYKQLLSEIDKKEEEKNNRDVEMEVSWGVTLKEKTDQLMKEKQKSSSQLTPFEKYLEKKKEKKKLKKKAKQTETITEEEEEIPSDVDLNDPYFAEEYKNCIPVKSKKNSKKNKDTSNSLEDTQTDTNTAELELLLMNEEDDKKHFSLKKIQEQENQSKSKRKKAKKLKKPENAVEDDFKLNVDDQRFSAIFNSHHFNIDPSDSHFRKTKAMETLIEEKLKRRNQEEESQTKKIKLETGDRSREEAELSALVKSIKRKSEMLNKHK